ncbi:helix-turn-helix transcriptional regulator [Haladaptatus sp. NG-SE-30]
MNRRTADIVVGVLVGGVLLVGGIGSWQAYQQNRALSGMGTMMGTSMGGVHGTNPLWYAFGTLVLSAVIGGLYLVVRDELTTTSPDADSTTADGTATSERQTTSDHLTTNDQQTTGERRVTSNLPESGGVPSESADVGSPVSTSDDEVESETRPRARVLDLLPEDERRILDPVLTSPGLTQIELRDRADFSKSKVSQTVSDLEKRGLLYRERQGRTYRVYPSDDLQPTTES